MSGDIKESLLKKRLKRIKKSKAAIIGLTILLLFIFTGLFGTYFSPYHPLQFHFESTLEGPSVRHLLGTDHLGRDNLSMLIYGARTTLMAAFSPLLIAFLLGIPVGLISGYKGGFIDTIFMRLIDVMLSFPPLILALTITVILGPSLRNAFIAIGVVLTPTFARITRGEVLKLKENEYIEAARAIGVNDFLIVIKHIFPNSLTPIFVLLVVNSCRAILTEAGLSFLGLGSQPPIVSWGALLRTGVDYIHHTPWMSFAPGISIFLVIMGLNYLGDGLRDIFDVKDIY